MGGEGRAGARRTFDRRPSVFPASRHGSSARNVGLFGASERSHIAGLGVSQSFLYEEVKLTGVAVTLNLRIPRLPVLLHDPVMDLGELLAWKLLMARSISSTVVMSTIYLFPAARAILFSVRAECPP